MVDSAVSQSSIIIANTLQYTAPAGSHKTLYYGVRVGGSPQTLPHNYVKFSSKQNLHLWPHWQTQILNSAETRRKKCLWLQVVFFILANCLQQHCSSHCAIIWLTWRESQPLTNMFQRTSTFFFSIWRIIFLYLTGVDRCFPLYQKCCMELFLYGRKSKFKNSLMTECRLTVADQCTLLLLAFIFLNRFFFFTFCTYGWHYISAGLSLHLQFSCSPTWPGQSEVFPQVVGQI